MKNFLIIGGLGFVGKNLARHLLGQNDFVTVFDLRKPNKNELSLLNHDNISFIKGDILNESQLDEVFKGGFDGVYHLASFVGIKNYVSNPVGVITTTIEGTRIVAEKCIQHNCHLFFTSTSEVLGRVTTCGSKKLEKGHSGNLILDLELSIAVAMDDRFVIRSYSPMETIAGGIVLDPNPSGTWSAMRELARTIPVDPKERFGYLVSHHWKKPNSTRRWKSLFFNSSEQIDKWQDELEIIKTSKGFLFSKKGAENAQDELQSFFNQSYASNPFRPVITADAIKTSLKWSEAWFEIMVKKMLKTGILIGEKGGYALSGYTPEFSQKDLDELSRVETIMNQSGSEPILFREITELCGHNPKRVGDLIHILMEQGKVQGLGSNFYLHHTNLKSLLHDIRTFFKTNHTLTVADFKNLTGLSRKTAIPLLEYLDKNQFTIRQENIRIIGDALNG